MTDLLTADRRACTLDDAIRGVIASTFDLPFAAVPDTASNQTIAGWDSLGQMELVFALEQRFGVIIGVEHIAGLQSFVRIREVLGELSR